MVKPGDWPINLFDASSTSPDCSARKAYANTYYHKTKERRAELLRAASRRYRQRHPEKVKRAFAEYRRTHLEILRERSTARKAKQQKIINSYKHRPCMDCQGWFEPCQMHFDHKDPMTKSFNISGAYRGFKNQLAEIKKCDVVCANCHALRTQRQIKSGVFQHMVKLRMRSDHA